MVDETDLKCRNDVQPRWAQTLEVKVQPWAQTFEVRNVSMGPDLGGHKVLRTTTHV